MRVGLVRSIEGGGGDNVADVVHDKREVTRT